MIERDLTENEKKIINEVPGKWYVGYESAGIDEDGEPCDPSISAAYEMPDRNKAQEFYQSFVDRGRGAVLYFQPDMVIVQESPLSTAIAVATERVSEI